MTDYNRITDYATKDGLPSGSTLKIVRGTEIHNEFNAIETAESGYLSKKADE